MAKAPTLRCAIYTRKSSEEGLDQAFNSLDAQREAGEAYIKSQASEGWRVMSNLYDDGGFSGGNMERPGLKRLLDDIEGGRIDVVVVYKIDRLTRSLADFARIVERFDAQSVSFVSVTQSFNTTSSMGRLTLNVLLSFAQFEREVTGERIRDKIAASKAKGMWMGGTLMLGYNAPQPGSRKLQVNETEAATVRHIFTRYLALGSVHSLQRELIEQEIYSKIRVTASGRTMGGLPFSRGALFHLLKNRTYLGQIPHKGKFHKGEHQSILPADLFDRVQAKLAENSRRRQTAQRKAVKASLTGKLFDASGSSMTPSFSKGRNDKLYRYYVSASLLQGAQGQEQDIIRRISAPAIEKAVTDIVSRWCPSIEHPLATALEVRLCDDGMKIELLTKLAGDLQLRLAEGEMILHRDRTKIRVLCPALWPVPGRRRLVIPGAPSTQHPNHRLIASLRKAHGMITRIRGLPLVEAAPASLYDRRVQRLAFLSPAIQRDIMAGRQPPAINLERLIKMDLPLLWSEQHAVLGWPVR